jgi:dTDP-4-amino-4,6-dideoxygalactose transaminase
MKSNLQRQYKIVDRFEKKLSQYTGAPYVVCVDCCTNALLLCLLYNKEKKVIIPKDTYVGVAMSALHAGKKIVFKNIPWRGIYKIENTNIYDAAKRFTKNMYISKTNMCLSFHYKKHLKIGRGGAILTDDRKFYEWVKLMRNNGKNITQPLNEQHFTVCGYNMLLHPDLARKGLDLLKVLPKYNDDLPEENYGDLSKQIKLAYA